MRGRHSEVVGARNAPSVVHAALAAAPATAVLAALGAGAAGYLLHSPEIGALGAVAGAAGAAAESARTRGSRNRSREERADLRAEVRALATAVAQLQAELSARTIAPLPAFAAPAMPAFAAPLPAFAAPLRGFPMAGLPARPANVAAAALAAVTARSANSAAVAGTSPTPSTSPMVTETAPLAPLTPMTPLAPIAPSVLEPLVTPAPVPARTTLSAPSGSGLRREWKPSELATAPAHWTPAAELPAPRPPATPITGLTLTHLEPGPVQSIAWGANVIDLRPQQPAAPQISSAKPRAGAPAAPASLFEPLNDVVAPSPTAHARAAWRGMRPLPPSPFFTPGAFVDDEMAHTA